VPNLSDTDITIFLKTHPILCNKELLTKDDLKQVLEPSFDKVVRNQVEVEANSTTRYAPEKTAKATTGFGFNMSPAKATNPGWLTNTKSPAGGADGDFERDTEYRGTMKLDATLVSLNSKEAEELQKYMSENVYKVI
jgi:hypothetical protein